MKTKISILVAMAILLTSFRVMPTRTIIGKVTSNEDGSALSGVNVVLIGTATSTVTDDQGNYLITAPDQGGILVFSFIGFKTKEAKIGTQNRIDVSLEVDVKQLSEVVVTGYGVKVEKEKLSNSVAPVSESLQGRVAGVQSRGRDPMDLRPQATRRISHHQYKCMKLRSNLIPKNMKESLKIFFMMPCTAHSPLFLLMLMLLRTVISADLFKEVSAHQKMPYVLRKW